ncbi:uncharacterized protein F4807DRAFT_189035 [Annulohypoxylon truncatum]|uniref:uncharacterized protein n=1 Tax=Annulohypoxylon truncatum TaxID=327061 RepID=UPI0020080BF3|nr:uncharacterized protein F4807DRAFT_189035 [Annulohypoxylon truncatum]KAI1207151.1 hypothetical protein F4807DRAFT_189035 [Annulohypoxylon truncatum]
MMFKSYTFVLLSAAFSFASASVLPRATCWTGEIHSPCNGATTGCTPDGILVKCEADSGAMIYDSMCGGPPGTCTYDAACNASCA